MRALAYATIFLGLGIAALAFSFGSAFGYVAGTIDLACVAITAYCIRVFARVRGAATCWSPRGDPYTSGYEMASALSGYEPETLRLLIRQSEVRVEEMSRLQFRSGEQAARGILDGYRAALRRAEEETSAS